MGSVEITRAFGCRVVQEGLLLQPYLNTRTQAATKEYARRVPMDMRSTRSFRSKRKAITAAGGRGRREGRTNINTAEYAHPSSVISSTAHVWLLLGTWQRERRELGASRGGGRQDLLGTRGLVSPWLSWTRGKRSPCLQLRLQAIAHGGATRRCCRLRFLIFSGSLLPSVDSRLPEGKNVREEAAWKTPQSPGCHCRRLSCFTGA